MVLITSHPVNLSLTNNVPSFLFFHRQCESVYPQNGNSLHNIDIIPILLTPPHNPGREWWLFANSITTIIALLVG